MRHGNPRYCNRADEFRPIQIFRVFQRRAFGAHQLVNRHAFGLRVQIRQARNQPRALGTRFVHAHNAAAAHFQPRLADFAQRVHTVFVAARVDDVVVAFGVGVQIVVVIIQTGLLQIFRHAVFQ